MTGKAYTVQDILDVRARAQALTPLLNLREGFTAEDDRLPRRVMEALTPTNEQAALPHPRPTRPR